MNGPLNDSKLSIFVQNDLDLYETGFHIKLKRLQYLFAV